MGHIDRTLAADGVRDVPLDARGFDYLRRQLTHDSTLCRGLLPIVDSRPGEMFCRLPWDVPDDHAYEFERGWKPGRDVSAETYVLDRLLDDRLLIAIADDVVSRPGDPGFGRSDSSFAVAGEIYTLVTGAMPPDDIISAIRQSNHIWHGISVICATGALYTAGPPRDAQALSDLVEYADEILGVAYDGQGFVSWRRL